MNEETNYEFIIDAIKNRDKNAFNLLYESTKKSVFYNILSYVADYEDAEDILQDTYVNFLKNIDNVDSKKSILGFLMVTSRNLSIDFLRKKKRTRLLEENENVISNDEANYDEYYMVKKIKKYLKPNELNVVIKHIYGDLTFKEIAEIDKKSLGTVLWIYNNAIKKLRKELENEES